MEIMKHWLHSLLGQMTFLEGGSPSDDDDDDEDEDGSARAWLCEKGRRLPTGGPWVWSLAGGREGQRLIPVCTRHFFRPHFCDINGVW